MEGEGGEDMETKHKKLKHVLERGKKISGRPSTMEIKTRPKTTDTVMLEAKGGGGGPKQEAGQRFQGTGNEKKSDGPANTTYDAARE